MAFRLPSTIEVFSNFYHGLLRRLRFGRLFRMIPLTGLPFALNWISLTGIICFLMVFRAATNIMPAEILRKEPSFVP
jgi:hypothetical protein